MGRQPERRERAGAGWGQRAVLNAMGESLAALPPEIAAALETFQRQCGVDPAGQEGEGEQWEWAVAHLLSSESLTAGDSALGDSLAADFFSVFGEPLAVGVSAEGESLALAAGVSAMGEPLGAGVSAALSLDDGAGSSLGAGETTNFQGAGVSAAPRVDDAEPPPPPGLGPPLDAEPPPPPPAIDWSNLRRSQPFIHAPEGNAGRGATSRQDKASAQPPRLPNLPGQNARRSPHREFESRGHGPPHQI